MKRKIALVDANSFYCSAEKIFRPDLLNTPVCVLSNNDGCVVSRDSMVKKIGVPMGMPWFQMQDLAKQHGILAFSSNYTLYGDISRRFMAVLAQFVPPEDQEVYSIDECFLDFSRQPQISLAETGPIIRDRVKKWTGLPVCVGVGSTKTLAKFANNIAKKQPHWNGVCDLTALPEKDIVDLLGQFEVRDVWGIGGKIARQLMDYNIRTAADLRAADGKRLKERFSVVIERTWSELNGVSTVAWEDQPPAKQQIIASRSFGGPLYTTAQLSAPIAFHMARAAEKLRQQGGTAVRIGVFLETNRFRPQDPQYSPSKSIALPMATSDSAVLTQWAMALMKTLWKPGFRYVKAGVMLLDLREPGVVQGSLFDAPPPAQDVRREKLMALLDKTNEKWGRGTMGIGAAGVKDQRGWQMARSNLSPCYTTNWDEVRAVS
jgi:DNA polymerase V